MIVFKTDNFSHHIPTNEGEKAVNLTIYRTLNVHKDSVTAPYRCLKQPPNSGLKYRKLPQFDDHLRRQNIHICLWAAQRTYIGCVNPSCHDTAAKSFRHFAALFRVTRGEHAHGVKECSVFGAAGPSNIFSAACPRSQHSLSAVDRHVISLGSG